MESNLIVQMDSDLEEQVVSHLGPDATPELLNLVRAALAAYSHALAVPGVTKEDFLAFMSSCWDSGVEQRQANEGEVDGALRTDWDVATAFACGVFLCPRSLLSS
jgi:hypothetical protein